MLRCGRLIINVFFSIYYSINTNSALRSLTFIEVAFFHELGDQYSSPGNNLLQKNCVAV